jgi:pimeloyl-ACP methyl ester carboxylesterase
VPEIELSAGTIEYEDTGGSGPVVVFLHGLTIDSTIWRNVVPRLSAQFRCVTPTFPLGAHRRPMKPDADLSLRGLSLLIAEFLERLDLREVTLVQNDWGGVQILIAEGDTDRIARLVITSSEAFDNYPPAPAKPIVLAAKIPGGLAAVMQGLRLRAVRRAPVGWGWMSKRPVPKEIMDAWFRPARVDAGVRRDLAKYVTSVPPKADLLAMAQRSAEFTKPVLIAWATEDKMFPLDHARRLADLFPDAKLVEIADSYTLIPEDQPDQLTAAISDFLGSTPA